MTSSVHKTTMGQGLTRMVGMGMAGILVAMTLVPMAGAASSRGSRVDERLTSERAIDRAEVENLQRWVSAGHADWCKDARLVAAEEVKRLSQEYSGDGFELNLVTSDADSNDGSRVTFEWAPLDGRELYRVTVERFDWLLAIARNVDSIVWVPTSTEIVTQE